MIEDWKKDLQSEKNLTAVFKVSGALSKSVFNRFIFWICVAVSIFVCFSWLMIGDVSSSADSAKSAADIAFNLSVQILGFLIGGFAIFATVSDPNLMVRLAQVEMEDKGLSVFKYIFFSFLSVFYVYVITLGLSISVKILSSISVISFSSKINVQTANLILTFINSCVFLVVVMLSAACILRLKSFIWNIYQALITFLAAADIIKKSGAE